MTMENEKTYILMRKNAPVLAFDVKYNSFITVREIYDNALIPLGAGRQAETFDAWWKRNLIAQSRLSFTKGLAAMGITEAAELKLVTHSLSLQNQYWTQREDENLKWGDINLFTNDFSEEVGKALFYHRVIERGRVDAAYYRSPEGCSIGELNKRWTIENGERYLIKEGGTNGEEAVNEVLASSLAAMIDLPCAEYSLVIDEELNRAYSKSKCFTDENTEIIHMTDLFDEYGYPENGKFSKYYYDWTVNLLDGLNIPNGGESIDKMLCVDYIMAQTDRHYNNIAVLHNIVSDNFTVAPLYDSGKANYYNALNWRHIISTKDVKGRPFGSGSYVSLEEQIQDIEHNVDISRADITAIESQYRENMNLVGASREKTDKLFACLRERAERLERIFGERKPTIDKSQRTDII